MKQPENVSSAWIALEVAMAPMIRDMIASTMGPLTYELHHVDTDLHRPFQLTRFVPIEPCPILAIGNTQKVRHARGAAIISHGCAGYPRHIMRSDWT